MRTLVIGLPLELDGVHGPQAKKVQAFVEKLKTGMRKQDLLSKVEILFWDERFSTAQAERVLSGSKLKNKENSAALDRVSAALILESYINSL